MVAPYEDLAAFLRALGRGAGLRVLPGRARPRAGLPRRQRPHAEGGRRLRRPPRPLRPPRPGREPDRGGDPRARRGRARDQAPPAGAGLPARRPAARARVRARLGAARARSSSTAGGACRPIAESLRALHEAYPDASLIIAHAGIADLAALSECFSGRPGVYFDTSVWSAIDLLDMFSRVSPGQVLYASDYPYGQQPGALLLALRTARLAGHLGGAGARHARPLGRAHRRRRAAPAAHGAARPSALRAAAHVRPHPPLPGHGDAAPVDAAGGHDRRPRARPQRLRGARRPRRGAGADRRAPRRRARPLADAARGRGRRRGAHASAARRSGSSTSRTSSR